tara:strand:+ start:769 stop:1344 length:576 start_codon:yes stop_codon:yes gene_type:complete
MELHDAVYRGDYDRVKMCMKYYRGNVLIRDEAITTAALLGHYEIVDLLLQMNVPVETNTMLINYQRKWETRQIKKLHRQTMHDMSSFTNGWCPKLSAACVAAFYGHKKMLKLLFDNGADMQFNPYACEKMENPPAWNPLTCALIGQQIEVAKILLRMNINMTDMKGQVPTLMHILLWRIPSVLVDHSLSYL